MAEEPYVFISYSHADQTYVRRLVAFLAEQGVTAFHDEALVAGEAWSVGLDEGIARARAVVVVMTPAAAGSTWVRRELIHAEQKGRPIVPLLLAGVEPLFLVKHIQHDDVRGGRMPSQAYVLALQQLISGQASTLQLAGVTGRRRVRYLTTVEQFAPSALLGREAELARLAAFATATEGPSYLWVRAMAWSGKSALMAWFVLHPPAGVRVVSFFVTARLQNSNDRAAFADNVVTQLAELMGEPVPDLTPGTREAHLLALLSEAAQWCRDRGERLVLVVDGLDEDRGVGGADEHSIAALLPGVPPAGLRVIVAGRPHPDLPSDVADHHPLRHPEVVWDLPHSTHAQAVRTDADRELTRLLDGGPVEQQVLGLIAVVGRVGLSTAELSALTGADAWQVDQLLSTAVARTFLNLPGVGPGESPVWTLGHDQLQQAAITALSRRDQVVGNVDRVRAWADRYRAQGWPASTPTYLLRGYFGLLESQGELAGMVACVTDPARHQRLRLLTGSDAVVLSEITRTGRALAEVPTPDLVSLGRVAVHRNQLEERSYTIPEPLILVWAELGELDRAAGQARAMADPRHRFHLLVELARVAGAGGDQERARRLADEAESVARESWQGGLARPLGRLAQLHSVLGDRERARGLAQEGEVAARAETFWAVEALTGLAAAWTALGEPAHARHLSDEAESAARHDIAVGTFTALRHFRADLPRARRLAAELEAAAQAQPRADHRAGDYSSLVRQLVELGEHDRARRIIGLAEAAAAEITAPEHRAHVLTSLAHASARSGDQPGASRLAATPGLSPTQRASIAMELAIAAARAGEIDRAVAMAREIDGPRSMAEIAEVCLAAGDFDRAETIIRTSADDAAMLATLARSRVAAGDLDRGRALATQAEAATGRDPGPLAAMSALIDLARAAAGASDGAQADRLATVALVAVEEIADPARRADELNLLARALIARPELAGPVVGRLRAVIDAIPDAAERSRRRADLARAAQAAGDIDLALALVEAQMAGVADLSQVEFLFGQLIEAAIAVGQLDRAVAIDQAHPAQHGRRRLMADALAAAGQFEPALALARTEPDAYRQVALLLALVKAAVAAGNLDWAEAVTTLIESAGVDRTARVSAEVVVALGAAAAGERDRARLHATMAETIAGAGPGSLSIEVARAFAAIGDPDRVRRYADEALAISRRRPDDLAELAVVAVEAGDLDLARRLAAAAEAAVDSGTEFALVAVAVAYARAGQPDQAQAAFSRVPRSRGHGRLAQAFAEVGEVDRAFAVALSAEEGYRDLVLEDLARATTDHEAAQRFALALSLPRQRARLLAEVARSRAAAGFGALARSLLATALVTDDWRRSVDALAIVEPAAFAAICAELVALHLITL